jgi:hypothetical protein
MVVHASAVEVMRTLNMIILFHIPVEVVVKSQIFSYSAKNVIEVNQIVAFVKFTTIK